MEFRGACAIDQKYGRQCKATEAIEKKPATTTLVIVRLLVAMNKTVLLAAPTGRASQRMSEVIPCFRLTQFFRQAQASLIIQYAHQINQGQTPAIESPFKIPELWHKKTVVEWIPKYHGQATEIQILTPMTRGSLGSANLNQVIHRRNNYVLMSSMGILAKSCQ